MEKMFQILQEIAPLSIDLKEHLVNNVEKKVIKKRGYLLQEGQVSNEIYFIEKGSVRCFYDNKAIEVCIWFMFEGDFVISIESFLRQKKGYQYIQALEDSTVWSISFSHLKDIYEQFPQFNVHRSALLEKYYIQSEWRQRMLSLRTAEERFQYLMETNSSLILRVPSKYVASYLNIHETYYSRIKKDGFK